MATKVYSTKNIYLFDGTEVEISPLKIKYLREFMDIFSLIKDSENDQESIAVLLECTRIIMKQHYPKISHSIEELDDSLDLPTVTKIIEFSTGIKINKASSQTVKEQTANTDNETTWDNMDLLKLESEVFMLGIWKNYDELEKSLSMPELLEILSSRRELDYQEKKFLAAMQGVDLDQESEKGQKEWEDMKARVFSKGKATDSKDVLALQGQNAVTAGFGIGMGLEYEDLR